jgi:hypothetical protein
MFALQSAIRNIAPLPKYSPIKWNLSLIPHKITSCRRSTFQFTILCGITLKYHFKKLELPSLCATLSLYCTTHTYCDANPLRLNPLTGTPLTGNPLTGNPLTGNPLTGNPLTGNPLTGNPLTGNPLTGNPLTGNPMWLILSVFSFPWMRFLDRRWFPVAYLIN